MEFKFKLFVMVNRKEITWEDEEVDESVKKNGKRYVL